MNRENSKFWEELEAIFLLYDLNRAKTKILGGRDADTETAR
jgi:hypothetical protein